MTVERVGGNWRVELFLKQFAMDVLTHNKDRWGELGAVVDREGVAGYVLCLTHADYAEAPVVSSIVGGDVKQTFLVLSSGFSGSAVGKVRNTLTRPMFSTLMLTRDGGGVNRSELDRVEAAARERGRVVGMFGPGNRGMTTKLDGGIAMMMKRENSVVFPLVVLSDGKPVFPSEGTALGNWGSVWGRGCFRREGSVSHGLCLPPLTTADIEVMGGDGSEKEKRQRRMTCLEIIRQVALGDLFEAAPELVEANPEVWEKIYRGGDSEHHPGYVRRLWNECLVMLVQSGYLAEMGGVVIIGQAWEMRQIFDADLDFLVAKALGDK